MKNALPAPTVRKALALVAIGGLIVAAFIIGQALTAPRAGAAPLPANCQQQPWWRGEAFRLTTRTLCDGPIQADGSWTRARNFYANSYYVPWRCDRYGCTGDYWVPVFDTGVETYRVTPDTVLPDEPGHIGNAGVVPA